MGLFEWLRRCRPQKPATEKQIQERARDIYEKDLEERVEAKERLFRIETELDAITRGRPHR